MKSLEKKVMGFGLFIALIPLLGTLLGFLKLTVWSIVLPLCLVIVMILCWKKDSEDKDFSWQEGVALGIFAVTIFMFMFGSFSYPWLEDDDPYGYAVTADHISQTHSFMKPTTINLGTYAEPDPVGYSVFMGVWHQLFGLMNFTLKFMNALIVSLSILFSFYFFRRFFNSENVAMFSTFVLACLPSFQTHFIFAQALGVMLFFPAFYFIERRNVLASSLIIGSMFVVHHLSIFVFGIFFIIYLAFNRELKVFFCGLFGVLLGSIYWIYAFAKYGFQGVLIQMGVIGSESLVGTGSRLYALKDFFFAPSENLINVSTGWGWAVTIVLICSVILFFSMVFFIAFDKVISKPKDMGRKYAVMLLWFLFSLFGVLAVYLPVQLLPFRWWTFLAVSVAMLCGAFLGICWNTKSWGKFILIILLVAIIFSSFVPKWQINTSKWAPATSVYYSDALTGLVWAKENIPNFNVYSFNQVSKLQGFNVHYCMWCSEQVGYDLVLRTDLLELRNTLKSWDYNFLLVNNWYVDRFGANRTEEFFNLLTNSSYFVPVYSGRGSVIFGIK